MVFHFLLIIDQHLLFFLVLQLNLIRQTYQRKVEHINRINLTQILLPEEEIETKTKSKVYTCADTCVPSHLAVIHQTTISLSLQIRHWTNRRTKHLIDTNLNLRISTGRSLCVSIDIKVRSYKFQTLFAFRDLGESLLCIPLDTVADLRRGSDTSGNAGLARGSQTDAGHQIGTNSDIYRHCAHHKGVFQVRNGILLQGPLLLIFYFAGYSIFQYHLHVEAAFERDLQILKVAHTYLLERDIAKIEGEQAFQTDVKIKFIPREALYT